MNDEMLLNHIAEEWLDFGATSEDFSSLWVQLKYKIKEKEDEQTEKQKEST